MQFLYAVVSILGEGFSTLAREGRWRLIPAFGLFLGLSVMLVLVKAISPIAPFVYSLF